MNSINVCCFILRGYGKSMVPMSGVSRRHDMSHIALELKLTYIAFIQVIKTSKIRDNSKNRYKFKKPEV